LRTFFDAKRYMRGEGGLGLGAVELRTLESAISWPFARRVYPISKCITVYDSTKPRHVMVMQSYRIYERFFPAGLHARGRKKCKMSCLFDDIRA
jgi:hypothetical protein